MDLTENNEHLAAHVADLLGPKRPVFAAATITPTSSAVAGRGTGLDSDFEIGSLSKGLTGLLHADALERGEVTGSTTLADVLPLNGTAAGALTLESLSTHRSGLPRLPAAAQPLRRSIALWRHGTNPYGETLEELLDQARVAKVGQPKAAYSNFGFELLGHALAAAAGTSYAALLHGRVADPLGLDGMYVPSSPGELRPTAVTGTTAKAKSREPWTGQAIGPAGGIRATIGDLATLSAALLDGTAPGVKALDPVATFGGGARIGAAWMTLTVDGRQITWHNGGTGGFRSWLGLDRDAGTAAMILSATGSTVDRQGFRLLASHGPPPRSI